VIVDRDVQIRPASALAAADAVLADAFADVPEACELFDVDMQELTCARSLIAWSDRLLWS
jgi:hypothetical protein